jgi:hypothetical protein
MDFNKTIDLIIRDLEEAKEIIDDLKEYPGVPAIQVEMAKAKCKNAADIIALLKTIPEKSADSQKPEIKPEIKYNNPEPETSIREEEILPPEEQEGKNEIIPINTDAKEAPRSAGKITEAGIFADTFGAPADRLNETLGNLRENDEIPDYFKSNPLTNLSEAIGINDRFLFIRELFDGNSESYNEAIRKLDKANSLNDAKTMLGSFTGDKNETEAAKQLFDLIKRKFRGDE